MWRLTGILLLAANLTGGVAASAGDLLGGEPAGPLTLIDEAGNAIKLKNWKFIHGVKPVPWLDAKPVVADTKGKKPALPIGPEYVEFREDKSPMYKDDVVVLVPLASVKQIDYLLDKKQAILTILGPDGTERNFTGPTDYVSINKFNVDGEVDGASISLPRKIQLRDGYLHVGIKSLRLPSSKPGPEAKGRPATVVVKDKEKTKHAVFELLPLYKVPGGYRREPVLMFQKTIKVEMSKLVRLVNIPPKTGKGISSDYEVYKSDGSKQGLTLLTQTTLEEKEPAHLVGLVGKIPGGYKLFPPGIISEVTMTQKE